ncbi:MAG: YdiU family protein [Intestinibacter bartlettii]|uniref:protein adenylyltransferase SelO n=1 Tax=Intestinibacter bartlettii TaxID=261299 RepID=UPI0026EC7121|nr:YdiU family protein [Intestinibacter bartlettii]MDO5010026.1 YdiU family protein [Intestinibacter bartlettii]
MIDNNFKAGFNFDNSYIKLPKEFYSYINLHPIKSPKLVILNDELSKSLGLNTEFLKSEEGIYIMSGNIKTPNGVYIAQAYAGHQFGSFTMLGDGRALLIGEQITPFGNRFDIQLKGSGVTPYSRNGDGRAVLGPMLREYIISEAMYGLNIPTTRSLSVISTGEKVYRETIKQGAILTRVASSHIRFGTFEYAAYMLDNNKLKALADYTIKRHFPFLENHENKYIAFLEEVIKLQASLVAKWQSVGFIHGVLNTDNMSICGETIDYGPCAFMDTYNPDTVFSSIDTSGRYSYKNQIKMINWNLYRLAETLLPLIDSDEDRAIDIANNSLSKFIELATSNLISEMCYKIGIFDPQAGDVNLLNELLDLMNKYQEDYTNTFIALTFKEFPNTEMFKSNEFANWNNKWQNRLNSQNKSHNEILDLMKNSNPAVIPRNHRVEEALLAAENGDFSVMNNLLKALSNPYEHSDFQKEYAKLPPVSQCGYKTYCGT